MLPLRVWSLRLFGLKTGMRFTHFGLESGLELGMVFEGMTAVYSMHLSCQFQMNKKEKEYANLKCILKNLFVCMHSNLSNGDIMSA